MTLRQPANRRANVSASRRFVFTRSPERLGISAGATQALMPQRLHLTIKPVACRSRLKQTCNFLCRRASFLISRSISGRFSILPKKTQLATSPSLRERNRVLKLCRIEGHIHFAMLSHGPSLHA